MTQTVHFADGKLKDVPLVVTVGVFDGLHIGHMALIRKCVELSHELNAKSMVVSFSVNPKMFCRTQESCPDLLSREKFLNILNNTGVNYNCVIDFSRNISKLTGEEFIAKICTLYNLKAMVVGENFKCGNPADCAGPMQISRFLSQYTSDAVLAVVPPVTLYGEAVSSSRIRRCLLTGDLETASSLLGRPLNLQESQNVC